MYTNIIVIGFYCVSVSVVGLFSPSIQAEIITDGSVGARQALNGPHYQIDQALGHTAGSNLFHSFEFFGLSPSESATFTGSDTVQNVISRVTGGQLSTIDGTLNSEVGQANFYFINPAGVVFGPNAQVNVPGDFHVSTASELRFADGTVFTASHPESSTLSMAAPEGFGFLNDHSASIRIEGSQLRFNPDHSVSFTSDTIEVNDASIENPHGRVHLTAQNAFRMQNSRISVTGHRLGLIAINSGESDIDASQIFANTGGDQSFLENTGIAINTQSLRLNNTEIHSITKGVNNAGAISIRASDDMQITRSEIVSLATENSSGDAGSITLQTEAALTISQGGLVSSSTLSSGNGNDVNIQAGSLSIDGKEGSETGIHNITRGSGGLGSIVIDVEHDLTLANQAQIISKTEENGTGGGGSIEIRAANFRMQNQALVSTESRNHSAAHNIDISIEESSYLDHSMIATSATQANGGNITLTSDVLVMNGGIIQANTLGVDAQAGIIHIEVDAMLANQGQLTASTEIVGSLRPRDDLNVIQSAAPDGGSGNLNLSAAELNISGAWLIEPKLEWLNMRSLIETPCLKPGIRDSKLTRKIQGGKPELPSDARSVPLNQERLERIAASNSDDYTQKRQDSEVISRLQMAANLQDCGQSKNYF